MPGDGEPLPEVPTGDVPDAIKQMIQDRHDAHRAAVEAAEHAAIVELPAGALKDVTDRASSIGGRVELLAGGAELRVLVPLPREAADDRWRRDPAVMIDRRVPGSGGETGPGILETIASCSAWPCCMAAVIVVFFGGALADAIGLLVDAAHGGS